MSVRGSRSFWRLQHREARAHAIILATLLWLVAAVFVVGWPGSYDYVGTLKGADFVHFYTLGKIALTGDVAVLHDVTALHELQAQLVPASAGDVFMPVYPPQTALLFAPLAWWPYPVAALLWALTTMLVYALAVRWAWQASRSALPDAAFVAAAAAGFPPFWNLVLHGQTTAVLLAGWVLGWLALERRRPFLAGLALGLLMIKPQFGLVLAVVVLACREWRMAAGAFVSAACQAVAVAIVLGPGVLLDYADLLRRLPEFAPLLEPRPYQMHSIAALTGLLPGWSGTAVWLALSAVVAVLAVRVWRTGAPVAVRVGVLVVATVLVNPHLTVYDATVLALPVLWFGGWIQAGQSPGLSRKYWALVYLLFVTLLVPTALFMWVQLSVLLIGWLFLIVTEAALRPSAYRERG